MFPASCPSKRMVCVVTVSSFKILLQCAMNASLSLAGKAAIRVASGSSWCSKKIGRSASLTSRRSTPFVRGPGVLLAMSCSLAFNYTHRFLGWGAARPALRPGAIDRAAAQQIGQSALHVAIALQRLADGECIDHVDASDVDQQMLRLAGYHGPECLLDDLVRSLAVDLADQWQHQYPLGHRYQRHRDSDDHLAQALNQPPVCNGKGYLRGYQHTALGIGRPEHGRLIAHHGQYPLHLVAANHWRAHPSARRVFGLTEATELLLNGVGE